MNHDNQFNDRMLQTEVGKSHTNTDQHHPKAASSRDMNFDPQTLGIPHRGPRQRDALITYFTDSGGVQLPDAGCQVSNDPIVMPSFFCSASGAAPSF
jgi:hypothetical protein